MQIENSENQGETGIFDIDRETQLEIIEIEKKKVRNKLFILAVLFFIGDLITLYSLDAVTTTSMLIITVIPLILTGLGLLSMKEPLTSISIGAAIVAGIWIYAAVVTGGMAAISGLVMKGVIVYLLIAGFQSALEVRRVKKEMPV